MGSDLIIVVFAVVVIGGMGSIMGSIVTGFALGVVEGLTKVFYPEASNTVIFVIMASCCSSGRPACSEGRMTERRRSRRAGAPARNRARRGRLRASWSRCSSSRRSSSIRSS